MSSLKFKTSDNSSSQGKPRVYFCCHPNDFAPHFDSLSKEIFDKCSCAVYFSDSETVRDEDFYSDLGQMQLFVVPVTRDFLLTENDALDKEFVFAINNHIPVLPIMLQQGLADTFNEKCGDLQFLDKSTFDETALSYEEKLESFLKSVIIGDKLAQKVRDNFDGYMFLSYRKKDRRLARRLMQLIHKSDLCRQFAIWYDEFLVPGENFNTAIKDALDKSDLFVLAVTPNLVNENNYIMQHEYPMAKQSGKPIFPAEMQATNKLKLSMKYRGLPSCTSADDEETFSSNMEAAVKGLGIPQKQDSAESRYLLGLAYLGGIDVEVDHKKAVELITSAANENHIAAIAKLADMYYYGIGTHKSYQSSAVWLEKLIDIRTEQYRNKKSENGLLVLCSVAIRCGDIYEKMRLHEDAEKKYSACLGLLKAYSDTYGKQRYEKMTECCKKLGDIYLSKYKPEKAFEQFKAGFDFAYDIAQNDFSVQAAQTAYSFSKKTADSLHKLGRTDEAEKRYLHLIETLDGLVSRFHLSKHFEEKADIYNALGTLYTDTNRFSEAQQAFEKALENSKSAFDSNPSVRNRMILSLPYFNLGRMYAAQKMFDKAIESYKTYCDFYSEFTQKPESSHYHNSMRNLYIGYGLLGDTYLKSGDADNAFDYHNKALDAERDLAIASGNVHTVRKLITRIIGTGKKYHNHNLIPQARILYASAEKHFDVIIKKLTDEADLTVYTSLQLALGDIHSDAQMYFAAKKNFKKYVEVYTTLAQQHKTDLYWYNTALGCKRLAEVYEKAGCPADAEKWYTEALNWYEKISPDTDKTVYYRQPAKVCEALGDLLSKSLRHSEAAVYYRKNITLRAKVLQLDSSDNDKYALANAYYKAALTGSSDAKEHMTKSLEIFTLLYQAHPDNDRHRRNVDIVQRKLKFMFPE